MTPIERAARAIYEQSGSYVRDCEFPDREAVFCPAEWVAATEEQKALAMQQAHAAIAAIREPSEVMKLAGGGRINQRRAGQAEQEQASFMYQGMIDALLEKGI